MNSLLNVSSLFSFNFYYDAPFWLFFTLILVICRVLSFNIKVRNIFLLIVSVLMLLAIPQFNIVTLLLLLVISLATFFIGFILYHPAMVTKKAIRIVIASIAITGVVFFLCFFKYRFIQNLIIKDKSIFGFGPVNFIFLIGVSYSSFKMMHFIIECYKKSITNINILNYISYIFFFPSFISGPINRYNHFCEQILNKEVSSLKSDLSNGFQRIIHGMFKKLVLGSFVYPYIIANIKGPINEAPLFQILVGLYAYTLYFYLDFSGYSDIAIGSAGMLGIELPENFNNPFFKKNIQQLWANWHMSFTGWLTDYIYWPIVRKLRNSQFFKKHSIFLSNLSIIVTFIACGMWHGETWNFIIWGLYHGIGIAVVNVYQKKKRKIKNEHIRKYFRSKASYWVGVFFTFNFFAIGLLFFAFNIDKLVLLIFGIEI